MPIPALIPLPYLIQPHEGSLTIDARTKFAVDAGLNSEFSHLSDALGLKFLKGQSSNRIAIDNKLKSSLGAEGYRLVIDHKAIHLTAASREGIYYGIQTLRQLGEPTGKSLKFPAIVIEDKPRFSWRGLMLDSCRHFWEVDKVKQILDTMARFKLNTFHWHLTDDQGWRIEIKKYPKLTEIGSLRKTEEPKGEDTGKPYGGFYTQEQVKDIVQYASQRHITVVPEIEMPGHSTAAIAAYPELSCTGGPFNVGNHWGVFEDIYCAGNEQTFKFLQDVLDEVLPLFPSTFVHIGGDEAPKTRWNACPKCKQRMEDEHLKNGEELQSYFIHRIEKYLNSKGKQLIGWDEILEGGLAPHAAVMSWRGREGGLAAAKSGHDAVMTPNEFCYLDHYQADPKTEPKAIGGHLTLEKVYAHNPTSGLTEDQARHIIGVQGNLWSEYIATGSYLDYMIFPRELAIAEVGWTPQDNRVFSDFETRLRSRLVDLDQLGIKYRSLDK